MGSLALATATACSGERGEPLERVLLVTIDTLRADHVGCYGATDAHTPQLDAVAARGVRFETAISPAPLTLPAHASLMTGLDPPRHGVRHNSLHRLPAEIPTLAEHLRDAGFATAAAVGAVVLDARFGLARGFDAYDDAMGEHRSGLVGYAERRAGAVVDAALGWLDRAPDRFFLWVHFYDPHASYDPPPGFASSFASRPYAGEIAYADAQLGRLLDGLEARFAGGRTLVVVTSDHGESLGAHGESTHSYTVYEPTQRVPLLLAGPGLPAGRVVSSPVGLVDVAPTILAMAGAEPLPGAGGRDLRDAIRGGAEGRSAYVETLATQLDHGWSPLLGLRTPRFKYIRAPRPELYDLSLDPGETRNLAAERPEVVDRLDRALERALAASRAPQPARLDANARAQLESLGYVAGGAAAERPLGRVGGPDPKDEIGLLTLLAEAEAAARDGRVAEALARLEAAKGGSVGLAALRAAVAVGAGRPELAERDARAVLARQPGRPDVLVILGRSLEAQGRFEEASGAYRAAAALDPRSVVPAPPPPAGRPE